jgi:hypothetical protein
MRLFNEKASALDSEAFRKGLAETGYVEGTTVAIESRFSDSQLDRLPTLAAELVRRRHGQPRSNRRTIASSASRTADARLWRRHAPALRPDRKSSEGRQRLQSRLNVPQIDFGLEKRDLVIERDLVDIDVPGPGSAVAPVTPAVAAPF